MILINYLASRRPTTITSIVDQFQDMFFKRTRPLKENGLVESLELFSLLELKNI
jgi:hypothetical protein